jgi:hypothetical protein
MFTGRIEVEHLKENDVTDPVANDISALLKKQRTDVKTITKELLLERMRRMDIVVAWNDNDKVVGIGVLTRSAGLNFEFAKIRHLIVADGLDSLAIGMRIVSLLCELCPKHIEYIENGAWVQNDEIKKIFLALGFKEEMVSRLRRRTPKS